MRYLVVALVMVLGCGPEEVDPICPSGSEYIGDDFFFVCSLPDGTQHGPYRIEGPEHSPWLYIEALADHGFPCGVEYRYPREQETEIMILTHDPCSF